MFFFYFDDEPTNEADTPASANTPDDSSLSNMDRFYNVFAKARGTRTNAQYAKDAGVSPTTLSKIQQKKLIPSVSVIKKLTSVEAAPQGNVTYEMMLSSTIAKPNNAADRDITKGSFDRLAAYAKGLGLSTDHVAMHLSLGMSAVTNDWRAQGFSMQVNYASALHTVPYDFSLVFDDEKAPYNRVFYNYLHVDSKHFSTSFPTYLGQMLMIQDLLPSDKYVFLFSTDNLDISSLRLHNLPISIIDANISIVLFNPSTLETTEVIVSKCKTNT